jgi:hypothetical protein
MSRRIHQPLGTGGTSPGPGIMDDASLRMAKERAVSEYTNAFANAGAVMEDQNLGVVLNIIAKELNERINEFLKSDDRSQVCLKLLATIRNITEIAPRVAYEKVEKLLGKQLSQNIEGLTPPHTG